MQYKTGIICNSQWLFSLSFSSSVYGCVLFFLCLCGCLFFSHFFHFCFDSRAFAQVLWNQLVHIHLLGIVVAYIFGIFNKQTNVYNTHFACSYNFASLNCCRCYCCRNIIRSFIRFYVECVFFLVFISSWALLSLLLSLVDIVNSVSGKMLHIYIVFTILFWGNWSKCRTKEIGNIFIMRFSTCIAK